MRMVNFCIYVLRSHTVLIHVAIDVECERLEFGLSFFRYNPDGTVRTDAEWLMKTQGYMVCYSSLFIVVILFEENIK